MQDLPPPDEASDNGDNLFDGQTAAEFAASFRRDDRRPLCQLYLISPLDVTGEFADRLFLELDACEVVSFQFWIKTSD